MSRALIVAAVAEAATGASLLVVPSLVGQLLPGGDLTGIAVTVARVTGIALIAPGIACWPGMPLIGMPARSALVADYPGYVGFAGGPVGLLLWPAVVLRTVLAVLLARALARANGAPAG